MQLNEQHSAQAPTWQIRLFGPLEIERPDGSRIRFDGKKVGALLALVALAPEKAHTRQALADRLWPESDPISARTRLRQELGALRTLLAPAEGEEGPLELSRTEVQLRLRQASTDAMRFLELLQEAARSADPAQKERLLAEAVCLYRADLLTEYDIFTAERLDFARRYERASRDLARLQQAAGNAQRAEETLQRLLTYDPLLEEVHADLIRLYLATRQHSRARRQYQELETALREQLNTEPSADIRALMQTITPGAPTGLSAPADENEAYTLPAAAPAGEVVFVPEPVPLEPLFTQPDRTPLNGQATAEPEFPPHSIRPRPSFSRPLFALIMLTVLCGLTLPRLIRRRHTASHETPKPQAEAIQYGKEDWVYTYQAKQGEKTNSEARAVIQDDWAIFATGLIQTETEDTDILTVKLAPDGKPIWEGRYHSAEHDCDRAFSIAPDGAGGVYVAGETFVPASPGTPEGWRLVLLHYVEKGDCDAPGHARPRWVRRIRCLTQNGEHRVRVCADGKGGAYVGGTALLNGAPAILLLHYDATGKQDWQYLLPQTGGRQTSFYDLVATPDGVFACGSMLRRKGQDGAHYSAITLCLTPTGMLKWVDTNDGPNNDAVAVRMVMNHNNVLFVGCQFGMGDPAVGGTGVNPGVVCYSARGACLWRRIYTQFGPNFKVYDLSAGLNYATVSGTQSSVGGDLYGAMLSYDLYGNLRWAHKYLPDRKHSYAIMANVDSGVGVGWFAGQTSRLPELLAHNENEIVVAHYGATGDILEQYGFRRQTGGNNFINSLSYQLPNGLVVAGQATLSNVEHVMTVLKYHVPSLP
jgi:DNA-binding SARP family transcriptional activator